MTDTTHTGLRARISSDDLRRTLEQATPGPWRLGADLNAICTHYGDDTDFHKGGWAKTIAKTTLPIPNWMDPKQGWPNGELIALVPDLAAEVLELRALLDTPPAPQETAGEAVAAPEWHLANLLRFICPDPRNLRGLRDDDGMQMDCHFRVGDILAAHKSVTECFGSDGTEARWIEDMKNACPHCHGSGHKDDVIHPTPAAATTDNTALVERALLEILDTTSVGIIHAIARTALASRPAEATSRERVEAWPSFEVLIDLIGEFGREVHNLMDDCETSGPLGGETHTITDYNLEKVSDLLDRIDALPFEEPGCILGTGAMLQAALKQTLQAHIDARRDRLYRILDEEQRETLAAYDVHPEAWQNDVERPAAIRATVDAICAALTPKASDEARHD